MQGRRYVLGWLTVGTVATVIALATVVFVRGAVGGDQVVGALSPADVSAQLSAAVQGGAAGRSPAPAAGSGLSAPGPGSTPGRTSTGPRSTPGTSTKPSSPATGRTTAPTPTHVSGGGSGTPTPTPSQTSVTRLLTSGGGSVVAQCTSTGRSAAVYLVSWSPAQGFTVHPPQSRGPAQEVEIEFESDQVTVSVNIHCSSAGPVQTVATDSGWGGGDD